MPVNQLKSIESITLFVGDGDGGGFYGAFASKLGSGASAIGKKVAQSEAGRSATKAAVKGATDAAAKDLTNRYLGSETTIPTKTKPTTTSKPAGTPSTASSTPTTTSTTTKNDSDEEYERIMEESSYQNTRKNRNKPSVLARFKPRINLKAGGGDKQKPQPRKVPRKEKIYKYALSKDADWESLPQALTLYNFRAEMRCDLEFRKGQVIQVMTRTDSQNDWWEGRIEDRVGIFPANYIKML